MNIKYIIQSNINKESVQHALAIAKQIIHSMQGQNGTKIISIDSTTAIIKVYEDSASVLILTEDSGILLHPRSGVIAKIPYYEYISTDYGSYEEVHTAFGMSGGWSNGTTPIEQLSLFPLIDKDNASYEITAENDTFLGAFVGSAGDYGNLYWWNGDKEDPVFLSWHGTPTRHFRVPSNINIPGISNYETSIPGLVEDTPKYTTFTHKLYQDGLLLALAPRFSWPYNVSGPAGNKCLILGACQNKTDNLLYIATLSDHYNAPAYYAAFSDGNYVEGESDSVKTDYLFSHQGVTTVFEKHLEKPGYYLTLWKQGSKVDGWDFVSESFYGDYGLPFFANQDGTSFVDSKGNRLSVDGSWQAKGLDIGSYSESEVTDGNIKFAANYDATNMYEYLFNTLASASIVCRANTYSSNIFPSPITKTQNNDADVVMPTNTSFDGRITFGSHNATNSGYNIGTNLKVEWYSPPPTCCNELEYKWTVPGTTFADNGRQVIVASSGGLCGAVDVTVEIIGTPYKATAKDLFKGVWLLQDSQTGSCKYGGSCVVRIYNGPDEYTDYYVNSVVLDILTYNGTNANYLCKQYSPSSWACLSYSSIASFATTAYGLGFISTPYYHVYTNFCQDWEWLFGKYSVGVCSLKKYKWVCP